MAQRLAAPGDRDAAGKALAAMGPEMGTVIEAEVKSGLTNNDKNVIIEVCRILAAVGTPKSVAPLTQVGTLALRARQRDVAVAAEQAILAIKARGK